MRRSPRSTLCRARASNRRAGRTHRHTALDAYRRGRGRPQNARYHARHHPPGGQRWLRKRPRSSLSA
nr:MAG TPA_asm: hypothetical protein [Caudoviricetes sp.]